MALTASKQSLVTANLGIAYAVMQRLSIHGGGFAEAKSEAMVALCEAADSYEPTRGAFSTWAWVKVAWHLKSWMRRTNRASANAARVPESGDGELECPLPGPDGRAEGREVAEAIEDALGTCTALTRAVAHLWVCGMTSTEIALELGVSTKTVGRRLAHARARLHECGIAKV